VDKWREQLTVQFNKGILVYLRGINVVNMKLEILFGIRDCVGSMPNNNNKLVHFLVYFYVVGNLIHKRHKFNISIYLFCQELANTTLS